MCDGSVTIYQRPQFPLNEATQLSVMCGNEHLPLLNESTQKIEQAQNVEVIHVLYRVIEHKEVKGRSALGQVEREENARRDSVELGATKDRTYIDSRFSGNGLEVDLSSPTKGPMVNLQLIQNGMGTEL